MNSSKLNTGFNISVSNVEYDPELWPQCTCLLYYDTCLALRILTLRVGVRRANIPNLLLDLQPICTFNRHVPGVHWGN